MAQVIDGSKKNFNTSVVGTSVTVIAQYNVRTEFSKQYYPNSRAYEFGNRPVWGETLLSFTTPLTITYITTRLLTSSTIITLNNSFTTQRIAIPSTVSDVSTVTKFFVTGTNSVNIPVNRDGGAIGVVSTVTDPVYVSANIYGTSLVTTGTYAFAIEQLSSTQTAGLSFGTIITAVTSTNSVGNFGDGTVYVYTVTNSTSIIAVSNTATISPTDGPIDRIALTGGTYTPPVIPPLVADILVVGGGGSGGNHNTTNGNGGGGAGGLLYGTGITLSGSYDVVVGAGGVAIANSTNANGNKGGNSSFGVYIAQGGGGGGSTGQGFDGAKMNGGSGGGSAYQNGGGSATQTTIGAATGYGNAGGTTGATWTGAGGGGAGGAGISGSGSAPGGDGGRGRAYDISGTWKWYAGGGGGGGNSSERAGDGYAGGGRGAGTTTYYNYATYTNEVNATTTGSGTPNAIAGTGGGGGGGSYWAANGGWSFGSGAGGSGIVIVRYPGAQRGSGGTVTTVGTYTIHTFTQTGVTLTFSAGAVTTFPTFRTPVTGPWSFTITNLTSTAELPTKSVISVIERSASLGVGNTVYITNTGTSSITVSAFGGTSAPKAGLFNAIYATGEIVPDTTISAVTATSTTSWQFNILGIKGTGNYSVAAVLTATSVTGSFGAGNTVIVKSITNNTQIVAYATGTSTPIAGVISGLALTGATGTLPAQPGDATYITTGTYSWIAPAGVTSVSVLAVGGGGGGGYQWSSGGGGGGGLGWKNNISVTPGQAYTVVVGSGGESTANAQNTGVNLGGTSYFISTSTVAGFGAGRGGPYSSGGSETGAYGGSGWGGGYWGDGGGRGGNGAYDGSWNYGGAGAGGYSGRGADSYGGSSTGNAAPAGGGGGTGGWYSSTYGVPAGGGVGIFGEGASGGAVGNNYYGGLGGSGGQQGRGGEGSGQSGYKTINGGQFGGGGGGSGTSYGGGWGGGGAVRIIWGPGRAFPATNVTEIVSTVVVVASTPSFKSQNIGGPSYSRRSPNEVGAQEILQQNHVPTITPVITYDPRRLTLQKQPIFQTNSFQKFNVESDTNSAVASRVFNTGTLALTKFYTTATDAGSRTVSTNFNPVDPYIYNVALVTTATWAFSIFNLSTAAISSITTGSIITVTTGTGSSGNSGVGNTLYVYSITSSTSVVVMAKGGSTAPQAGSITGITATGSSTATVEVTLLVQPASLTITPAYQNKTTWNLITDGDLVITSTSSYTISSQYSFPATLKAWGAGGGGTSDGGIGGGGGYAGGNYTFTTGSTHVIIVGQGGGGVVGNRNAGGGGGGTGISSSTGAGGAPTGQYQVAFNGTSQYLTTPSTANYNLSSGDWTVECWVYVTANGNNTILTSGTPMSATHNLWQINSDRLIVWQTNPAGNWNWPNTYASAAGVIPNNAWTHVAAVRYGSNFSMYVNGTSVYSTNSFSAAGTSGTLYIGTYYANVNNDGSYFRGNISNFRIVKGTAVYTSAFTTPTTSLTAITNTVLLICKSASFVDLSVNAVTINPANSPTISVGTLSLADSAITPIMVAGGGGGGAQGGIGRNGGAGGGTTGGAGAGSGGGGGTQSAVGAGGVGSRRTGASGSGGNGGYGATGSQSSRFASGYGTGGWGSVNGGDAGSGGGGGGYYGGGEGGGDAGGFGGGGGSGYIHPTLISSGTLTAGSGQTPGNNADSDRGTAALGGVGGTNGSDSVNSSGFDGKVIIRATGGGTEVPVTYVYPTTAARQYFGLQAASVTVVPVSSATTRDYNVATLTNLVSLTSDTSPARISSISGSGPWMINIDQLRSTTPFSIGSLVTAYSGSGSFGSTNNTVVVAAKNSSTSLLCEVSGLVAPTTGTIIAVAPAADIIIPPQISAVNEYTANLDITVANQNTYRTSFNGSSDYYTLSSSAFAFGLNNFTVEAWVYLNALPTSDAWPTSYSSHMVIATVGTPSQGDGIGFIIGQTKLLIQNNDTQYASSSVHGMAINTWYHLAYVRVGDTFNFYVNGISKGSAAFSGSAGVGSTGYLGCETGQGAFLNGYISNLRMVNGVAVYTGPFAPAGVLARTQSAGRNISAITGNQTTLLTFASATDTDLSTNNYTLTKVNSPTITGTVISGSTATSTTTAWSFTISNVPTTSTARLVNGTIITANTGLSSTGNFGTNNTVFVNTITNGTLISCIALGGTTPPVIGSIDSIATATSVVTATNIAVASTLSGGSFTVVGNNRIVSSGYSSVLFPIWQTSGKVYLEFAPISGGGASWYVGLQRAPGRVGSYEAGVGATGNLGTGTIYYPANGSTSSAYIDLDSTSTVSWNGGAVTPIPGTGQLYFGIYNGTTSTQGSGIVNWGTSSFTTPIVPVPIADVSATGTSLGSVTYSVSAGALPLGAVLDSNTGIIYWYRQPLTSTATALVSVTASAAGSGESITKALTLTIQPGATSAPAQAYSFASPITISSTRGQAGPNNSSPNGGSSAAEHYGYFNSTGQTLVYNAMVADTYISVPGAAGYLFFTVPATGTWRIYAQGGGGGGTNKPYTVGAGVGAEFALNAGDVLWISTGIQGAYGNSGGSDQAGGAGGGATVVAKASTNSKTFTSANMTLLLMAAGGNGQPEGRHGSYAPSASSAQGSGGSGYNSWLAQSFNGSGAGYGGMTTYGGFGGGTGTDDSYGAAGGYDGLFTGGSSSYIAGSGANPVRENAGTLVGTQVPGAVRLTKL